MAMGRLLGDRSIGLQYRRIKSECIVAVGDGRVLVFKKTVYQMGEKFCSRNVGITNR